MNKMQEFEIWTLSIPSVLDMKLLGAEPQMVKRSIKGYSLEDAKKRAGIQ